MLLLIGPAVALVGIVAVVFVMRHKAVEKRSMYSARRSQIEHKVRAARQRTLTPRGRSERPEQTAVAAPSPFAAQAQQTATYEAPAWEPPPMAPPEPSWTPAPSPASEKVAPLEPVAAGTAAGSSWSVVSSEKDMSVAQDGG